MQGDAMYQNIIFDLGGVVVDLSLIHISEPTRH